MNNDLISRSDIKDHIGELLLVYSGAELANAILNAIDNAEPVEPYISPEVLNQFAKYVAEHERPQGECKSCRHRDPEDKKCDCGALERQGCSFPVSAGYYCKYYEEGGVI